MANEVAVKGGALPDQYEGAGETTMAVLGLTELPPVDPDSVSARITKQMLAAESPEDLIAAGQTWSFKDLLGVPVEAHDVIVQRSRIEGEGPSTYVLVQLTRLDNGDELIASTSAENVMHRLAIAKDKGWLPFRFKVEQTEVPTERGFKPYIVKSV